MFSYVSPLHEREILAPAWLVGLIDMMDAFGIKISFHWPRCCLRLGERLVKLFQAQEDTSTTTTTTTSTTTSQRLRQGLAKWCSRWCCGGPSTGGGRDGTRPSGGRRSKRLSLRRRERRMFGFQSRRWLTMAKRRPIAAISVLGLLMFLGIYITLREENYEKIGIEMLAEKEKILQEINNDLIKSPPMDERQIFEMDQYERRNRFKMVCDTMDSNNDSSGPGLVHNLITTTFNLTYCVIPRSDNTFWLQMLRYLHHDYVAEQPLSPFQLDPEQVHTRPFVKTRMHVWKMLPKEQKQTLLNTKIFMSVQDPYMRLWSTYLRAMVLPEMWTSVGARIYVRRPNAKRPKGMVCGDDVTFGEFITYVMDAYEKDFAPYYTMCDPCQLHPYYTIRAETATRDNQYILEHLKLDWAVKQANFEDWSLANKVKDVIAGSYKHLQTSRKNGCTNTQENLNNRLWKIFRMEGIVPEAPAPPPLADVNQSQLTEMVVEAHRDAVARGVDVTSQKRKYMVAAYKNLNPGMVVSLEDKYRMDFKLFSYDPHPHDIYGGV